MLTWFFLTENTVEQELQKLKERTSKEEQTRKEVSQISFLPLTHSNILSLIFPLVTGAIQEADRCFENSYPSKVQDELLMSKQCPKMNALKVCQSVCTLIFITW